MEIEIITTKKKLTKSIVNQMRQPSLRELQLGTAMGYLINVKTKVHKAILIKCEDEFFIIPANYIKYDLFVCRKIGKWSQHIKFDSERSCNSWWTFYQARMREAINQIYV